ncbi:unnamed protein product [Linum trigynum]|uniref:Uncharacterized protein n=1 Tax=Linum trigynum TaxID=586398 RepID=A0AAV2EES0_9ROSI
MRRTWCHEVVAVSGVGSHQAVKGEIKTSSWFMEAKARASTPSSYERAQSSTPTRHQGYGYQLVTKAGQEGPRGGLKQEAN